MDVISASVGAVGAVTRSVAAMIELPDDRADASPFLSVRLGLGAHRPLGLAPLGAGCAGLRRPPLAPVRLPTYAALPPVARVVRPVHRASAHAAAPGSA